MILSLGEPDNPTLPFMYVNDEGKGFTVCINVEKLDSIADIIFW